MRLLLLSDIHGNFTALQAIEKKFGVSSFDYIINCGDSLVYGPFPNETLAWLTKHNTLSILGNTDKKVIKLLRGKSFKKPGKQEKRIMYTWTADTLSKSSRRYLKTLSKSTNLTLRPVSSGSPEIFTQLGIFHGSPAAHHEFLFDNTPDGRFFELAEQTDCQIIVTGHSHTPYHKYLANTHFINPGSVGRMFDGDPKTSCAILTLNAGNIQVEHFRISYRIDKVVSAIKANQLPDIYCQMFLTGKKLN